MIYKFGANEFVNANRYHWTCLHFAALWGHLNIITLLIENGADLDLREAHGQTPLRLAFQYPEIITLLIENSADLEPEDRDGL